MSLNQAIAMNRFGLGVRKDQKMIVDPKRYLWSQLENYDPNHPIITAMPKRAAIAAAYAEYNEKSKANQSLRAQKNSAIDDAKIEAADQSRKDGRQKIRAIYADAVKARLDIAVQSENDFAEHLVHFWANHFAISVDNIRVIGFAGDYEFTAIRPHILGSFKNMLVAAITHPAMLLYLDQAQSIGPNSIFAQSRNKRRNKKQKATGLNENLAREILELYSLGVRSGYDQNDVSELARALTGLTIGGLARGSINRLIQDKPAGDTIFVDIMHEPGKRQIMGRQYDAGKNQIADILSDLALHPATAHHIATKLARHFIKNPSDAIIAQLKDEFLKSGGNLSALYKIIIESPSVWPKIWDSTEAKFKSPWAWTLSAMRGLGIDILPGNGREVQYFKQLGQPVWQPGSPAGYDDQDMAWLGGSALLRRSEFAARMVRQSVISDPRILARELLPSVISPHTMEMISRAESPEQGLTLLLLSPEFLRH